MMKYRLQVTANALNKRSRIPASLPDEGGIVGVVLQGFSFIGERVQRVGMNGTSETWYRDRDGYYYMGRWLMETEELPSLQVVKEVKGPPVKAIPTNKDWGFIDFKIDELWKLSKGKNIKVAILDSGLNFDLPDFINKENIIFFNAEKNSSNKDDCLDNDPKGHGTDCAGMLCAQGEKLFGVAPEATLHVIKITDANGDRTFPAILNGLSKSIEMQVDVISMSFSVTNNANTATQIEAMKVLIAKATALNIAVVAAVGDSGDLPFPVDDFPSSFPDCLSIGGITKGKSRSRFSTISNFLDLMGPGEDLMAIAQPNSHISGTSFSTPFVAGIIALLKSIAREQGKILTTAQLFDILKKSADRNIPNYTILEHGFGIANPVEALKIIQSL